MKKFKQVISLVISFLLILSLFCGCQKTEDEEETSESETTTESNIKKITFPEGMTLVQIAEKLEKNGICTAVDFVNETQKIDELKASYDFLSDIDTKNKAFYLEGYVFPDTYEFLKNEGAKKALSRFLNNTERKIDNQIKQRAGELNMTLDQLVTIASIIQKEGIGPEMAQISSVLHCRLKNPSYGKLECDVTINYVNDFITNSKYLSGDTKRFAALYNTYKCKGVPAGAICNPGEMALTAAAFPTDEELYFFVTDKDKNYYFAKTYEEHLKNCKACGIGQK